MSGTMQSDNSGDENSIPQSVGIQSGDLSASEDLLTALISMISSRISDVLSQSSQAPNPIELNHLNRDFPITAPSSFHPIFSPLSRTMVNQRNSIEKMPNLSLFSPPSIFDNSRPIRDFQEQTPINISNEKVMEQQSGDDSGLGASSKISINATENSKRVSSESRVSETDQLPSDDKAEPSFKCRYCSIHEDTHEMVYSCPECDKRFSRKCLQVQHMRMHTGERPYTCLICSKKFGDRSNARAHIRAVHKSEPTGAVTLTG
ncbi:unnamed protein product [Rodentolepis nana]|uniref:C2H2-type domain-containing protein n=1 Tax=Rodentolepis nana TaxID=102285 RepID=A0A0R3TVM3_RODNA|nr:unnamed protein product [Rodentolepis nana]